MGKYLTILRETLQDVSQSNAEANTEKAEELTSTSYEKYESYEKCSPPKDQNSYFSYTDDETSRGVVPRLPWQLERLITAASAGALTFSMRGVPDPARYVMGWLAAHYCGDRQEAIKRLWEVYEQWQQSQN